MTPVATVFPFYSVLSGKTDWQVLEIKEDESVTCYPQIFPFSATLFLQENKANKMPY